MYTKQLTCFARPSPILQYRFQILRVWKVVLYMYMYVLIMWSGSPQTVEQFSGQDGRCVYPGIQG